MPQSPGHLNCFCLSYQLLLSIFFSPTLAFAFLPSSDPPSLLSFLPFFLSTQNIAHHNGSGAAVVTDLPSLYCPLAGRPASFQCTLIVPRLLSVSLAINLRAIWFVSESLCQDHTQSLFL